MEANYFTILYWFCHTSTWIRHRYTHVPHLEPPSLPVPSLWVIPVHRPQASCILHWTGAGDSFHIWYYTCVRVPFFIHPCQHLSVFTFLWIAILTGMSWYLIVVLICISLMICGVKQSFHVPIGHLHVFFQTMRNCLFGFCPLFNQVICCLAVDLFEFFIYFGY